MSKLKLNLNDLKIESFETSNVQKKQGTVNGELPWTEMYETNCVYNTCVGNTCDISCGIPTCPDNHCTKGLGGWCEGDIPRGTGTEM